MKIEIELLFKNKKIKDNLVIEFNENLLMWIIKTENQKELNEILKEKSFSSEKDIINFLNKHKYKFNKNELKKLKKPHVKSFVFDFEDNDIIEGHDGLNSMVIIKLKFKGRNAYFYTSEHGHYSGFNSFWKSQHEGHDSQIWKDIFKLDKQGYICFNDLYDRIDSEFDSTIDIDNEEDEFDNIVEYAKSVLNEDGFLIIDFIDRYISLLNDYENEKRYDSDFEVSCVCDFYFEHPEFYDEEIKINWKNLEKSIGKIESISKYKYDLLNQKIKPKEKNIIEKKTKI